VTLDAVLLLKVKQFLLSLVAASCFCPPSQHSGSSSAHFPCFVQTRGANTKRVAADPRLLCPAWTFLLLSVDEAVGELPDLEVCSLHFSVFRREERRRFSLWSLLLRVLAFVS